ncbi:hypothetical protein DY000_02027163 [Brassica cretica]|uniref:Uncharacterized protein n=1 Tax=Brassica cretica TaxID=69181 RepID=A0ABQ7E2M2_BRACR|nr:hypothetical protein DY000_02027163 [Brassica cretica]
MRPVEEERARRQWVQDDMLLYRCFMKVKERGCAVKERISKMSQGLSLRFCIFGTKTRRIGLALAKNHYLYTCQELMMMRRLLLELTTLLGPGTLISFQKKISGGAKKNGGQGDVVVVGFTSHRLRLDEEDL